MVKKNKIKKIKRKKKRWKTLRVSMESCNNYNEKNITLLMSINSSFLYALISLIYRRL